MKDQRDLDAFAAKLVDALGLPRTPQEHRALANTRRIRCTGCRGMVEGPTPIPIEAMRACCTCPTLGTFRYEARP